MKKLFLLSAVLTAFLQLWAEPIDRITAMNQARAYLATKGKALLQTAQPYRAPRRGTQDAEDASYYVFNVGGEQGYVIVSGDDRTEQILGYVDNGHFDVDNLPINMRAWLQYYSDVVKHLDDNNIQLPSRKNMPRRIVPTRKSVPILVASRWNQGSPYNNKCPNYYKGDGTTGRAVTGCTATAIAQIINYYKHPETLKAAIPAHSVTYTLDNGTTKTVTCPTVAKGTPIDWENMCDVYNGSEPEEEQNAVAELMLYVGMAVKMGYGASSGAVHNSNVAELLYKYFDFADGAYCADRYSYSADEWEDLLYSELSTGHPMSYQGFSTGGGHAFVIDGYDGEGLFHVNWGWGGSSDGWFVISILNPGDNSGIGASSSSDGYTMSQNAIIGVRLPGGEKLEGRTALSINDIKISGTSISSNYINWTGQAGNFHGGIVEMLEDGTLKLVSTRADISLNPNYYVNKSFNMSGRLSEGVHRLSPASKLQTNKTYRPVYDLTRNYIEATVKNGTTTLRMVTPNPQVTVEKIEFPGSHVVAKSQDVRVTFKNVGDEHFAHLYLLASPGTDPTHYESVAKSAVLVRSGDSTVVTYSFTPYSTDVYNVWISRNESGTDIIGNAQVQIIESSAYVAPDLSVTGITITNTVSGTVYGDYLDGKVTVKNMGKTDFNGRIKMQTWTYVTSEGAAYGYKSSVAELSVAAGKTVSIPFSFQEMRTDCNIQMSFSEQVSGGSLRNGGVWDHGWAMHPGIVGWKPDGAKAVGTASTTTTNAQWCGVYLNGIATTSLRPNKNMNTIYAFGDKVTKITRLDGYNVVQDGWAEQINLVSDTAYVVPVGFDAGKATFRFDVSEKHVGKWQAFTMPFTPDSIQIEGVEYALNASETPFVVYEYVTEGEDGQPTFQPAEKLTGNTPYIISCSADLVGKSIRFVGEGCAFTKEGDDKKVISGRTLRMYGSSYSPKLSGVYMLNEAGDAFEYVATSTALAPMSAYLVSTLDEAQRPARFELCPVPVITAVESVPVTLVRPSDGHVLTLDGRVVPTGTALQRGVYVIDGRKVVVK
ncbi:MAG: C10 family peptidase [Bacteroidaceae bacterium]|nr:C10 family peptidase [Bacteroidaceae bacterium]